MKLFILYVAVLAATSWALEARASANVTYVTQTNTLTKREALMTLLSGGTVYQCYEIVLNDKLQPVRKK